MIRPVPGIAAMAPYALAALGGTDALSLAQNESALPPSPAALQAGAMALATAPAYPDPDWTDLRAAIAETHDVPADAILCGAGSMELIGALIRAYAGPGDAVLGTAHGYGFAATAAEQAGARYDRAPEPNLAVSVDALLGAVTPETRLAIVCNPGNPTGTRIPNSEILRLRADLPGDVLLLVDQAYAEFDDQDHAAILALPTRGDTVVTRTLSKAYALAGLRVGWGIFPEPVAREMRKVLNPNNLSVVSQAVAAAALRDGDHMRRIVAETARHRDATAARLRALGLEVPASHTNFLLIAFQDAEAAQTADATLRAAGLILRAQAGAGLPHALRATIGPAPAMDRLVSTLEESLR